MAPQENDDDDSENEDNSLLPQNIDANVLENVTNCNDFILTQKQFMEYSFTL